MNFYTNSQKFTFTMATEDSITFVQENLAFKSFPIFEDIKREGKLCDVVLKVMNVIFVIFKI